MEPLPRAGTSVEGSIAVHRHHINMGLSRSLAGRSRKELNLAASQLRNSTVENMNNYEQV